MTLLYPSIDLRGGHVVRLRQGDYAAETVYGDDGVAVATSFAETPGPIGIPGLDAPRRYRVEVVFPSGNGAYLQRTAPTWLANGAQASGRYLAKVGLPMPILAPEHSIVLQVTAL